MPASILDKLLLVDRERRRASKKGGFAAPAFHERAVNPSDAPYFVTNMRSSFVPTRIRKESVVWAGFSECPVEAEDLVVRTLYDTLWRHSEAEGWPNRCKCLASAMETMRIRGFEPKALIVPLSLLEQVCGTPISAEDAAKLMFAQGYVAESNGIRVFPCSQLPEGSSVLAAAPELTGAYIRVDTYLAVMIQKADSSLVLVGGHGMA